MNTGSKIFLGLVIVGIILGCVYYIYMYFSTNFVSKNKTRGLGLKGVRFNAGVERKLPFNECFSKITGNFYVKDGKCYEPSATDKTMIADDKSYLFINDPTNMEFGNLPDAIKEQYNYTPWNYGFKINSLRSAIFDKRAIHNIPDLSKGVTSYFPDTSMADCLAKCDGNASCAAAVINNTKKDCSLRGIIDNVKPNISAGAESLEFMTYVKDPANVTFSNNWELENLAGVPPS